MTHETEKIRVGHEIDDRPTKGQLVIFETSRGVIVYLLSEVMIYPIDSSVCSYEYLWEMNTIVV